MNLSSLNPLRCDGTSLPMPILMMCKLIVIFLLLGNYVEGLPAPFLPMLSLLDEIQRPDLFRQASIIVFLCASVGLLFNRSVRICALLAGTIFLLQPFVSRVTFFYGNFFCGSMLFLSGLYDPRIGTVLHRAQFSIMYFGAALSKVLDPDWHNGQFIDFWLSEKRSSILYGALSPCLPEGWFAILVNHRDRVFLSDRTHVSQVCTLVRVVCDCLSHRFHCALAVRLWSVCACLARRHVGLCQLPEPWAGESVLR
jgi:hypothetical protein